MAPYEGSTAIAKLAQHIQLNDDTTKQDGKYYMLQEPIHIISALHATILWNTTLVQK